MPSAPIGTATFFKDADKEIRRRLVDNRPLEIFRNRTLKLASRPGESEDDFRKRCDEAAQAAADKETAKITTRSKVKQDRLQSALELAQRRVEELDAETKSRASNELVAGAGAVLGALFGGRRSARSIGTAISGVSSRRGVSARAEERYKTAQVQNQHRRRPCLTGGLPGSGNPARSYVESGHWEGPASRPQGLRDLEDRQRVHGRAGSPGDSQRGGDEEELPAPRPFAGG